MKLKIVILLILIIATLISCQKQPSGCDDCYVPGILWVYKNKEDWCNLYFYETYSSDGTNAYVYIATYYYYCDEYPNYNNYRTQHSEGIFGINENIKPFSEWNECNIELPFDTTKNWFFRFEGKNIPENISFLYDINNNIGDTLVLFDSVNNIRYYFRKNIKNFSNSEMEFY